MIPEYRRTLLVYMLGEDGLHRGLGNAHGALVAAGHRGHVERENREVGAGVRVGMRTHAGHEPALFESVGGSVTEGDARGMGAKPGTPIDYERSYPSQPQLVRQRQAYWTRSDEHDIRGLPHKSPICISTTRAGCLAALRMSYPLVISAPDSTRRPASVISFSKSTRGAG